MIALCRKPTPSQLALALDFMTKQAQLHMGGGQSASVSDGGVVVTTAMKAESQQVADQSALADFCHVLINTNEFIYLD